MAYVITDACVSCGTCEGECPVGAISAGDGKYEIAADTCIDCGTCAGACPTGAAEALLSKSCHLSTLLQMALLKGAAIYKHLVADGAFKRSCHL